MRLTAAADVLMISMVVDYSCFITTVNAPMRGKTRSRNNANGFRLPLMAYDPAQRRAALSGFIRDNSALNVSRWTTEAGLSEATVRGFLHGRTRTLGDETYELLAAAASSLLDRNISASELRGNLAFPVSVPIRHYVGAGDEIYPVDGDGFMDYVEAPPGFEKGQAFVVRGDSMRPVYDDSDVLFCRRREAPPNEPTKRAVIVEVKDGPLFVKKLLPGTKKGRYHLLSINPVTPILVDRPVVSIGRIGWVKPVE